MCFQFFGFFLPKLVLYPSFCIFKNNNYGPYSFIIDKISSLT